jgi:hypothetical protein
MSSPQSKYVRIGAIVFALLVMAGGVVGYLVYTGSALDRSSKAYVDEAIPAITKGWSPDELLKRESPAFLKATSDAQLMKLFEGSRRLGVLKSYEGSKGEAKINYMPNSGKMISADYTAQATFANGKAQIKVLLIQVNGQWKIQGFSVTSPLFLKIVI